MEKTPPAPPFNEAQWFIEEAARAARDGHARMMKTGGIEALYLYFKRGALTFDTDAPAGFELGWQERAPTNLEVHQLIAWTTERSRRLACFPE